MRFQVLLGGFLNTFLVEDTFQVHRVFTRLGTVRLVNDHGKTFALARPYQRLISTLITIHLFSFFLVELVDGFDHKREFLQGADNDWGVAGQCVHQLAGIFVDALDDPFFVFKLVDGFL